MLLLADETLLHIELQSTNDRDMGLRMARTFATEAVRFVYGLRDVSEWRAEEMLASPLSGIRCRRFWAGRRIRGRLFRGCWSELWEWHRSGGRGRCGMF